MPLPEKTPGPKKRVKPIEKKPFFTGQRMAIAGLVAGVLTPPAVYLGKTAVETVPVAMMGEAGDQLQDAATEALESLNKFRKMFMPFFKKFANRVTWLDTGKIALAGGAGVMADIATCLSDESCTPVQTFQKVMGKMEEVVANYPELVPEWRDLTAQFAEVQRTGNRVVLFTKAFTDRDFTAFDKTQMLDAAWSAFKDEVLRDINGL